MVTAIEPQVAPTGRYSVGETCKHLGIHRNTLRKYTDEGHIKCGFREETARKIYTGQEILQILEIPDVIKKLHICYPNPRGHKEIEPRGNSWL